MSNKSSSTIAAWLNCLSDASAMRLFSLMQTKIPFKTAYQISGDFDREGLQLLQGGNFGGGQYWEHFSKCTIADLDMSSSHPRWQINVSAVTSGSLASEVKKCVSSDEWSDLVDVSGKQAKIFCHWLAYRVSSLWSDDKPIPEDAGRGGSISHHCDTRGCCEVTHLSAAKRHIKNLARQRCTGVLVMVFRNDIIQERPCPHATGNSLYEKMATSCRKVLGVNIEESAAANIQNVLERDAELAELCG